MKSCANVKALTEVSKSPGCFAEASARLAEVLPGEVSQSMNRRDKNEK
jgi:hypothetical protein